MEKIICPKCGNEITIDVSKAIDENGDVIPQFKRFHFLDSILPFL